MKAITAVCSTGASVAAISASGRISRPHHPHRGGDGENAEIKMYLSKLKDLVPFMPRNRKLSKLEIIQHVIDYICELQTELETHPEIDNFDPEDALNLHEQEMPDDRIFQNFNEHHQTSNPITRQPLVVRQTPNTILSTPHHNNNPVTANNGNTITTTYSSSHTMSDKSTTDNGHSRPHC